MTTHTLNVKQKMIFFKKPLDKLKHMWYNVIRKRKGERQKMKKYFAELNTANTEWYDYNHSDSLCLYAKK